MSALKILTDARELLSVPERWTQGWFAKDIDGHDVSYGSPKACRWCLSGALGNVDPLGDALASFAASELLDLALGRGVSCGYFVEWQDASDRTHGEVLQLLDKAINLAREREGSQ